MWPTVRSYLTVALVAGIALFTNLGGTRLWDRDEPRNAGCTREMLARADWVTPYFNAEIRTHKPVLLYWFMMSSYAVFGQTEFAARFWSAALGVGTCLLTCHIGRRLLNAQAGLLAGVMLATALWFTVAGRAATPDSVLIFFGTAALAVFVEGANWTAKASTSGRARRRATLLVEGDGDAGLPDLADPVRFSTRWPFLETLYVLLGFAVLAKGPVGFVLPLAVIGMYLLIIRLPETAVTKKAGYVGRLLALLRPFHPVHFVKTCLAMRVTLGVTIALAVALPWYIWVGLRTDGAWLYGFFWEHNVVRATSTMEGHGYGPWFYPAAILVCFFPWSIFAIPTLLDAIAVLRREAAKRPAYIFLCCWVGVYVVLFSLAKTKLPSYVTPCYPALALLTAAYLDRWITGVAQPHRAWPRISLACFAFAGVALMIGLPLVVAKSLPGEEWLGAVGLVPIAGAALAFYRLSRDQRRSAVYAVSTAAVSFSVAVFAVLMPLVDRHQENHQLLSAIDSRSRAPVVGSFETLEPSWVFYGNHPVREFYANEGSFAVDFLQQDRNHFLITTIEGYERLRKQLPENSAPLAQAPYFLRRNELVVIGYSAPENQTARRRATDASVR